MNPGQFTCRKCGGVFDKETGRYRSANGNICRSCMSAQWRASAQRVRDRFSATHGFCYQTLIHRRDWEGTAVKSARSRSRKNGIPFSITKGDVKRGVVCPVFGTPLIQGRGLGPKPDSPSLDKVIPSRGYVPGNVRVISFRANTIKRDCSPDDLLSIALYAYTATGHTLPDIHAKVNEIAQRQVEYAKINAGTETVGEMAPSDVTHWGNV